MTSESLTGRARGRWPDIMRALAPNEHLLRAIELSHQYPPSRNDRPGPKWFTFCPLHGGKSKRAFAVYPSFDESGWSVCNSEGSFAGFEMLMRLNAWSVQRTGQELGRFLDGADRNPLPPIRTAPLPRAASKSEPNPGKNRKELLQWWLEAVPLDHLLAEPVRRYFAARGLGAVPALPTLRCHPGLQWTEKLSQRFPTLLAKFVDARGRGVGLHRTFLTADGAKAPIFEPRLFIKALDETLVGSAVQLFEPGTVLGIAEGIETALAVYLATGMPMWAATGTALMRSIVVPAHVQRVVIWADYDELSFRRDGTVLDPGRDAAQRLAERLRAEHRAVVILPADVLGPRGVDWNDVWIERGAAGFPTLSSWSVLPSVRHLMRRIRPR